MLKKAGIVVAVATGCVLAASPFAFADDNDQRGEWNVSGYTEQRPIQACGNDLESGVIGYAAKHLKNNSSDDVDCEQKNSSDN